eukprot:12145-Heterococcus_DN1.PRE.1
MTKERSNNSSFCWHDDKLVVTQAVVAADASPALSTAVLGVRGGPLLIATLEVACGVRGTHNMQTRVVAAKPAAHVIIHLYASDERIGGSMQCTI